MKEMLRLEHVYKTYNNTDGIKDISFIVNKGEFVSLLGSSGCGKTTTLKVIAGLEKVNSGKVYIDGKDATNFPPQKRDVTMVFQNYALFPHFTVFDNIAFGLKMRKVNDYDIVKKVKNIASILEISEYLDRKPSELSGGQKQRVALARALVVEPKILLLDEPLSNIDAVLRRTMILELKSLHKKLNTTIVYVTHNQLEAISMSDRIIIMKDGRIIQEDTPEKIFTNPKNRFVASFIGEFKMNFIEGRIEERVGDLKFVAYNDIVLNLTDYQKSKLWAFKDKFVILGIRPSDIYIKHPREGLLGNDFSGVVDIIEHFGINKLLIVKIKGFPITILVPKDFNVSENDTISFSLLPENFYFFDVETGENIFYEV